MTYSKWLLLLVSLLILRTTYTQNFWNPIPYPDSTKAYAMNVEHDNFIFYSNWRDPDGIYRSNKNNLSWEFTGTGNTWTFDIAFTSDTTMFFASAHCILKSEDLGITFDTVFLSIANIVSIEIDENDGIWAGFPGGILFSSNYGLNWDSVLVVDDHELFLDFAFGLNNEVYAVSTHYTAPEGGFYKSLDNGLTWINSGLSGENANTIAVNSSGEIFVGCYFSGVFRSTDNGTNWNNIKDDIDASTIIIDNENKIFCGNAGQNWVNNLGVHVSNDNGDSWEIVNTSGLINKYVTNIYLDNENYIYVLSRMDYGNQLYKSNNPIVGIQDHFPIEQEISIFPNPCSDYLEIKITAGNSSNYYCEILDAHGNTVIEIHDIPSMGEVIDISKLHEGIYFCIVYSSEVVYSKTILVNK